MASTVVKRLLKEEDELFFVPNDIIVNILKRLPAKSLLRFRCVCKDWNDLFKTSFFIKQHFHYSSHSPSLLLKCRCLTPSSSSSSTFSLIKQLILLDSDKKTPVPLNAPSIYSHLFRKAKLIGSSYGLLCIQLNSNGALFLWNPATREVQHVPDSTNNFGDFSCLGFGFSTVVNDYKIVKIYHLASSRENRVEIYSLSTGSWKEVVEFGNFESIRFICFRNSFKVTDQAMYFFAYKEDTHPFENRFIVSFDMVKEMFTLIPVPSPKFLQDKVMITYENKLALLSHNELWIMDEKATSRGSGQIWNKEFLGSTYSPHLYPMTIWRDEAVLKDGSPVDNMERFIYLLNRTTGKLSEFLIAPECFSISGALSYAESLVAISCKDSKK